MPPALKIPVGTKFGRWRVVREPYVPPDRNRTYCDVVCECGRLEQIASSQLMLGKSHACRSCCRIDTPGPPPQPKQRLEARFWAKVNKASGHKVPHVESECWLWTASRTGVGYGKFGVDKVGRKTILKDAHRVSWELAHGPIPDGLWVLHRCDVRACVRPDHLFLGTVRDNNVDLYRKRLHVRQARTHCSKGHPFTPENTNWQAGVTGARKLCRICQRRANRKCYRRRMDEGGHDQLALL